MASFLASSYASYMLWSMGTTLDPQQNVVVFHFTVLSFALFVLYRYLQQQDKARLFGLSALGIVLGGCCVAAGYRMHQQGHVVLPTQRPTGVHWTARSRISLDRIELGQTQAEVEQVLGPAVETKDVSQLYARDYAGYLEGLKELEQSSPAEEWIRIQQQGRLKVDHRVVVVRYAGGRVVEIEGTVLFCDDRAFVTVGANGGKVTGDVLHPPTYPVRGGKFEYKTEQGYITVLRLKAVTETPSP